jgi:hypothetical protein
MKHFIDDGVVRDKKVHESVEFDLLTYDRF